MRFLRGRRRAAAPIREAEAYARLHGERTGELISVVVAEPKRPIPHRTGDMTGELLRRAFEARLDARDS
jgi:hypothetical protein